QSRLDLPYLRLRTRCRMVERIRLDAAYVRLRLCDVDRARGQHSLARGRSDQGRLVPERPGYPPTSRRRLVGIRVGRLLARLSAGLLAGLLACTRLSAGSA